IGRFQKLVDAAKKSGSKVLSGDAAFDLHQTDGFLIELTESLAANEGLTVDMVRFKECKEKHKEASWPRRSKRPAFKWDWSWIDHRSMAKQAARSATPARSAAPASSSKCRTRS